MGDRIKSRGLSGYCLSCGHFNHVSHYYGNGINQFYELFCYTIFYQFPLKSPLFYIFACIRFIYSFSSVSWDKRYELISFLKDVCECVCVCVFVCMSVCIRVLEEPRSDDIPWSCRLLSFLNVACRNQTGSFTRTARACNCRTISSAPFSWFLNRHS